MTTRRIRVWLHRHAVHVFCRTKWLPPAQEFIYSRDGAEVLDVTNQSAFGRVVHY